MPPQPATRTLEFVPSRQRATVDLVALRETLVEFLELYADVPLVDGAFVRVLGEGDGDRRLCRLLEAAGFTDDLDGFLGELLDRLVGASWERPPSLTIGGVPLPTALALEVLERVIPGDDLFDVKRLIRPLRVEVELTLLHPSDLTDEISRVVRSLRRRGVSVYANLPLLMHLNDGESDLLELTSGCRRLGIDVHHLVVAGHPLQQGWSAIHPVPVGRVLDLATALRREGSGRELPRLIVQTALGEFDFGLTGRPVRAGDDGSVAFRLPDSTIDELRDVDRRFELPSGVELDELGRPVVPVTGTTA